MDPAQLTRLVAPVLRGDADYAKGNRFFKLESLRGMPRLRLFGNSLLSFMAKFSSGYWDIFDPTNGYTAIHGAALGQLPLEKISQGYFFESDLLFRLNTLQAVVVDVPMDARYGGEPSHLSIPRASGIFLARHLANFGKRIFYSYYLRNFNIASLELVLGLLALAFGTSVGVYHWTMGTLRQTDASAGTVMLAALPVMIGVQLLIAFLGYDMRNTPRSPLNRRL